MSSTADSTPQGRPRKTDYFATFLNTLGDGAAPAPAAPEAGGPMRAASLAHFAPPAATRAADPLDSIVRSLAASNGEAQVKDLVGAAGNSLGGLLSLLQTLQNFGLVTVDGAAVRLTADGAATARKLI
jgi:hypothetical protein